MVERDVSAVIGALSAIFDGVFAQAESVRRQLAACFEHTGGDPLSRRDIASIEPHLEAELRKGGGLLRGIGVVLAPGLLMDARLWIDWWVIGEDDVVGPTHFDFDPDSLDYYDYTHAEWFLSPQQGTTRCLVGPYVDFSGLNDYIVTATIPVRIGADFVGVSGADLRVDEIERRLYAANRGSGGDLLLANSSDRVVASTSTRYVAGSLLRPCATAGNQMPPTARTRHQLPGLSWSVVSLD